MGKGEFGWEGEWVGGILRGGGVEEWKCEQRGVHTHITAYTREGGGEIRATKYNGIFLFLHLSEYRRTCST